MVVNSVKSMNISFDVTCMSRLHIHEIVITHDNSQKHFPVEYTASAEVNNMFAINNDQII